MRRPVLRALVVLVGLWAVLALYAWTCYSPAAPAVDLPAEVREAPLPVRLRDGPEHDAIRAEHGEPYVLALEPADGTGALLYFGASHTRDPDAPQLDAIRARWTAFEPTVALCEGRGSYFVGRLIPRFAGLPEPALVHALARADDVPLHSLEPTYGDEVAALLEEHAPVDVALYFTMRVYASESGGEADEGLALHLAGKRTDVDGLRGTLDTIEAIDAAWAAAGGEGDWRTDARERSGPTLTALSDASRRVRGEHMARLLVHLVERGERVFAVVGSGHVIRQEWALRASLGAEPALDQPAD